MRDKQLVAFYTYSAACGIFSCITTGLFMPLFLERTCPLSWASLACLLADGLMVVVVELARKFGVVQPDGRRCEEGDRCVVEIMGTYIDTAAYRYARETFLHQVITDARGNDSLYTKSVNVGLQAVTLITISVLADTRTSFLSPLLHLLLIAPSYISCIPRKQQSTAPS